MHPGVLSVRRGTETGCPSFLQLVCDRLKALTRASIPKTVFSSSPSENPGLLASAARERWGRTLPPRRGLVRALPGHVGLRAGKSPAFFLMRCLSETLHEWHPAPPALGGVA